MATSVRRSAAAPCERIGILRMGAALSAARRGSSKLARLRARLDDGGANSEATARARAPRFGLSAKLLVLTILFVMIAEVLIYVPSIANFRLTWLADRVAVARTVALVLYARPDEPEAQAPRRRGAGDPRQPRRQDRGDEDGQPAPAARRQRHAAPIHHDIDLRDPSMLRAVWEALDTLFFCSDDRHHARGRPGAEGRRLRRDRDRGRAAARRRCSASRATSCCSR